MARPRSTPTRLLLLVLLVLPVFIVSPPPPVDSNHLRPDHLDAVPLERNGGLNRDFRREVVLGQSAEDQTPNAADKLAGLIRSMFAKADKDGNGKLSKEELKAQIVENTLNHLTEGRREAEKLFDDIDANGDGKVDWSEYQKRFLVDKNLVDASHADEHEDHEFDVATRKLIETEKFAFDEADADSDGLDLIEFVGFQHPEQSKIMLRSMAEDILQALDENRDGQLDVDEFAKLPPGESSNPKMDAETVKERRAEFAREIDRNSDGEATFDELLAYVDPKNQIHAELEVNEIFDMCDKDRNNQLTLAELLSNAEALVSSGFIHPKERLHDDL